jgi:NhaP-type Na+/H+ or K+/H+ antiporter
MAMRMAAVMALVSFILCLVVGTFEANNPFGTTVYRALVAMIFTLFIGMLIGAAFRVMLKENLSEVEKKLKEPSRNAAVTDR